jgi:hypothetical protein
MLWPGNKMTPEVSGIRIRRPPQMNQQAITEDPRDVPHRFPSYSCPLALSSLSRIRDEASVRVGRSPNNIFRILLSC